MLSGWLRLCSAGSAAAERDLHGSGSTTVPLILEDTSRDRQVTFTNESTCIYLRQRCS